MADGFMLSGTPLGSPVSGPIVVGIDEAGRGPLAGPVVAAAVVLGPSCPEGLADSKKLSAKRREDLDQRIRESCALGLGIVEPEEIDQLNILVATMHAMTRALEQLITRIGCVPDEILIDGNLTPHGRVAAWRWPARPIVGGDGIEPCISAASIIAKVHRDRLMVEAAQSHPHYGWERNKGYGTAEHMAALRTHGPTSLHRRSFAPVAQLELI